MGTTIVCANLIMFGNNMKAISIGVFFSLCASCISESLAFTAIPKDSGISGYVLAGGGYTKTSSNMIVGTNTTDLAYSSTDSLFDAPASKDAFTTTLLGEVRYTFASSNTVAE